MRRGLTMIEMMLALVLLSVVMVAAASWTKIAVSAVAAETGPARRHVAVDAVMRMIQQDLVTGDFVRGDGGRSVEPRVAVDGDDLLLRTRVTERTGEAGPVTHVYGRDPVRGELHLESRTGDGERSQRVLLEDVRQWKAELDENRTMLSVEIVLDDGSTAARSLPIHE